MEVLFNFKSSHLFVYHMCWGMVCMLQESALLFHQEGSKDQTQVLRLYSKPVTILKAPKQYF